MTVTLPGEAVREPRVPAENTAFRKIASTRCCHFGLVIALAAFANKGENS
jgi:hypothetical protein